MTTTLLQTNTLSPENFQWIQDKYRAVDAMNVDEYATFLDDNLSFRFGNNAIEHGKAAALASLRQFWQSINGLNHQFINVYQSANTLTLEAIIDYTRKDNKIAPVACTTLIDRNEKGLASAVRVYLDPTPIFQ